MIENEKIEEMMMELEEKCENSLVRAVCGEQLGTLIKV